MGFALAFSMPKLFYEKGLTMLALCRKIGARAPKICACQPFRPTFLQMCGLAAYLVVFAVSTTILD